MDRVIEMKKYIRVEMVDKPKKVIFEMGGEPIVRSETYAEFIKRMEVY